MILPALHINFFGKRVHSFHFFGVLGYITGLLLGVALGYLVNLETGIILLMGLVGAASFFGLAFLLKIITGKENIVYYHHEIVILICCAAILYGLRAPVLPYLDITVMGIGAFLGFGRIGCYSVGCCHGRPHSHGVQYGQSHVNAGFTWYYKDIPLLPVQLIESAAVFGIVIFNSILILNNAVPGTVVIVYTVIYGLMRYTLEFFRGDPERPSWYGLSEAQWTTLALMTATSGLAMAGWLPLYNAHLVILVLTATASLVVVLYHHQKEKYALLAPPHLAQLAEGLRILNDGYRKATAPVYEKTVDIYATGKGLCMSCGQYNTHQAEIKQYTISLQKGRSLNKDSATAIAKQIALLKGYPEGFEIIDRQNGVYHLLFTAKRYSG